MQKEQVILHQIAAKRGFRQIAAREAQHEFVPCVGVPPAGGGHEAAEKVTGHVYCHSDTIEKLLGSELLSAIPAKAGIHSSGSGTLRNGSRLAPGLRSISRKLVVKASDSEH